MTEPWEDEEISGQDPFADDQIPREEIPFGGPDSGLPTGWQAAISSLADFIKVSASAQAAPGNSQSGGGPSGEGAGGHGECLEWCPICRAADAVRAANEPQTREQLSELQQEAMLTARAVLDHYLNGSRGRGGAGADDDAGIEEIPID